MASVSKTDTAQAQVFSCDNFMTFLQKAISASCIPRNEVQGWTFAGRGRENLPSACSEECVSVVLRNCQENVKKLLFLMTVRRSVCATLDAEFCGKLFKGQYQLIMISRVHPASLRGSSREASRENRPWTCHEDQLASLRRNSCSFILYLKTFRPSMKTTGTSSLNVRRSSASESTSISRQVKPPRRESLLRLSLTTSQR